MQDALFRVLAIARHGLRPQYDAKLRFMQAQIKMLRARIDIDRVVPSDREQDELLRLGADFAHDVKDLLHVVVPETYRKWLRPCRRGSWFGTYLVPSGSPRTWRVRSMNNVLMVGNDENHRLMPALASLGFVLTTARDSNDLDEFDPHETHAVVVQLGEAHGDAFRLIYRLRRSVPHMPVIAIAPYRDPVVEQHATRCGANFVLAEPLNVGDLATFLGGYVSLSMSRKWYGRHGRTHLFIDAQG